jgi:hypothetical protein
MLCPTLNCRFGPEAACGPLGRVDAATDAPTIFQGGSGNWAGDAIGGPLMPSSLLPEGVETGDLIDHIRLINRQIGVAHRQLDHLTASLGSAEEKPAGTANAA